MLEYDCGRLQSGEIAECDFELTNNSKNTIDVDSIISGCHCLKLIPSDNKISPGETMTIHAIFDSSDRKSGKLSQVFCVYVSPMKNPIVFIIKSDIIQYTK